MKILLLAAMTEEIAITLDYLESEWEKKSFFEYSKNNVEITPLITGVGSVNAAFGISRQPDIDKYDFIVNPGICAALSRTLDLERVYLIKEDSFGDLGIEETDGSFYDQHDLDWTDPNKFPYSKGKLKPKKLLNPTFLPSVTGITVNKLPGTNENIERFERKYHADILSLDSASILYACRILDLQSIQYRVTVRYVEPRQKAQNDLEKALAQLNMRTIDIINSFKESKKQENSANFNDLFQ